MININQLLSFLVLVKNEEIHIERCLENLTKITSNIYIVDSDSTDATIKLAQKYTSNIVNISAATFSDKFNQALDTINFPTKWVMRIDADEVVLDTSKFIETLSSVLKDIDKNVVGFYVNRRYYFLQKWIKNGSMYPRYVLRIIDSRIVRMESRMLDEKMIYSSGITKILNFDIADINLMSLNMWFKKHITYARREAQESRKSKSNSLIYDLQFDEETSSQKMNYYKTPIFIRPFIYFFYRFIIKLGFLDGIKGIMYHFFHAFIYREMVDFYILKYYIHNISGRLCCENKDSCQIQ